MEEATLTLRSIDSQTFTVSKKGAFLSRTIKELVDDLGDANEIPVKVSGRILKLVIEWMETIKDNVLEELKSGETEEDKKFPPLSEEENRFCDALDDDTKVDMILAANLLDMKHFLDILMISTAILVKGASPDELRKVLERTEKPIPEDLMEGVQGIKQTTFENDPPVGEPVNTKPRSSKRKEQAP